MRRSLFPLAVLAAFAVGCDSSGGTQPDAFAESDASIGAQFVALAPAYQKELAAVRAAYASVKDTGQAAAAGHVVRVTECLENPAVGGMGYHYLNPGRITPTPVGTEPQVLVFSPKNGKLQLGAVEYIVPYELVPATGTPPELFGHQFHQNPGAQLWMLHAWLWRHNPDGVFADWNPAVSCP